MSTPLDLSAGAEPEPEEMHADPRPRIVVPIRKPSVFPGL